MADRREKIILGLDAGPYVRGLATASTATKAFVRELDGADSRMSNLTQTALALGPALVPIGAAAVPAVAALTAGLGAAAGAAGVAALAFSGVGDALDAMDKYQVEPTKENLQALRQTMDALGPAGRDFVRFMDSLDPKIDKLQNTAQAGLFPGLQEGIEEIITLGPQANRIIDTIATTLGDLAAEGGAELAGPKFRDFFDYIETEARPILLRMGRTIGNVAEGLGNMLVGFDPLTDQFGRGLLGMSRDFAEWSRDLEDNEGFQSFVEYVQRVSPEVWKTLGVVAEAFTDIVVAAAPVGEATLPIIQAVARVLGAIAESPIGPVLIGAAAGISALSRAVALYNAANGSAIGGLFGKLSRGRQAAIGAGLVGVALGDLASNSTTAGKSVNTLSSALSGAAIGFGVGGPWGAAIGGAAGALLDLSAGSDSAGQSMIDTKAYADALAGSFDDVTGAATRATRALVLENLRKEQPNLIAGLNQVGVATRDIIGAILGQEGAIKRVSKAVKESGNEWYEYGNGGAIQIKGLAMLIPGLRREFEKTAEKQRRNIEDTKSWKEALEGLPKDVVTEVRAKNFDLTFKDVARLKKQYDLTPRQVETLFRALNITSTTKDVNELSDAERKLAKKHDIKVGAPGVRDTIHEFTTLFGWIDKTPDKKSTKTDAPGIEKTTSQASGLAKLINDTIPDKKDVNTSAPGADKAIGQFKNLDRHMRTLKDKEVALTLNANSRNVMEDVQEVLDNLNPFADGGVLPGYTPGRDNQIIAVGGGEAVMRPEWTRAVGEDTINEWNRAAKYGGVSGARQALAGQFADGGLVTLDTRTNPNPNKPMREIDRQYAQIAREFSKIASQGFNKGLANLTYGFHWPLPRRYGPSGTWGSYASGGSHPALDWPAPLGTPIYSTLPGKVSSVQHLGDSYGNHVRINHGKGLESISAHMQRTKASVGERVSPGELIGLVDSTGNSTGNHLHLEFRRNGVPINYTSWLHGGGPMGIAGPMGVYDGDHKGLDRAGPEKAKAYARSIMGRWGWGAGQWPFWEDLGNRESGWRWYADNPSSSAYGIPQALPGSKMASAGSDWLTNAGTQIDWMAGYITDRYDTPAGAIRWHNAHNWYDSGGWWMPGTMGTNATGRPEAVLDPDESVLFARFVGAIEQVARRAPDFTGPDKDDRPDFTSADDLLQGFNKPGRDPGYNPPEGIDFPEYLGLSDKEQAILDRAGEKFGIGAGMDRSEIRQEMNDLIGAVEEVFGDSNAGLVGALERFKKNAIETSKALERERAERDKLRDQLQATRQKANEFGNTVAGNFMNDPFGGSLDEFYLQTNADKNDARRGDRLRSRAERLGLDGPLAKHLLASGNIDLLAEIVAGGRSEVRKAERAFESRNRAANQFGNSAADQIFGERIAKQTRALERATQQWERLRIRFERIEDRIGDRVEAGARKGTKDGVQGKNKLLHQMTMERRG